MPTPIKHAPRATLSQVGRALLKANPQRPFDVARFITEVYRIAVKVGYDPVALIAQCCFETANKDTGKDPFSSELWTKYLNPAGIGQTDSGPQDRLETDDPLVAAHAYCYHVGLYVDGDQGWVKDSVYRKLDPRAKYVTGKLLGSVTNVEDFGGGIWASAATPKAQYAEGMLTWMRFFGWQSDAVTPPVKPPVVKPPKGVTRPYILVTAGHRSTGAGGEADSDPIEASLTGFLAADYEAAFHLAGYECDWFQEDLDHDALPTETVGTLDTVAYGAGQVLRDRPDSLSIMFDCHYNGPHSPAHVIVPDDGGLVPAIGTAPADDTALHNIWDVKLAGLIAAQLHDAVGMGLWTGKIGVPGVMSETECGVGLQGWRLAMFGATADSRQKAIRIIVEHGGYYDPAAEQNDFTEQCAAAVVSATNQFVTSTLTEAA